MRELFDDYNELNETKQLIDRMEEIQFQMIEADEDDFKVLKAELDDIAYLLDEQGVV